MKRNGLQLQTGATNIDIDELLRKREHTIFERAEDWSSCAYFYLDRPEGALPELLPYKERVKGLLYQIEGLG